MGSHKPTCPNGYSMYCRSFVHFKLGLISRRSSFHKQTPLDVSDVHFLYFVSRPNTASLVSYGVVYHQKVFAPLHKLCEFWGVSFTFIMFIDLRPALIYSLKLGPVAEMSLFTRCVSPVRNGLGFIKLCWDGSAQL